MSKTPLILYRSVAQGAVDGRRHQDDLVAGADVEDVGHLAPDQDLPLSGSGRAALQRRSEKTGNLGLQLGVHAHQNSGHRLPSGAHEATPVDARRGGRHSRLRHCGAHQPFDVDPISTPEGRVHAPLGVVVGSVHLELPRDQVGPRLDHLGDHAMPGPDHGHGREIPEGEGRGGDERALPVAPEVPPRQPPPHPPISHLVFRCRSSRATKRGGCTVPATGRDTLATGH